jgi:hypothetical protein
MRMHAKCLAFLAAMLTAAAPVTTGVTQLREEARIAAGAPGLAQVASPKRFVSVSASGAVAVTRPGKREITIFSSTGRQVAVLGKGIPIAMINRIGWKSDSLWVWDISQRKVFVVSQADKLIRTVDVPEAAAPGPGVKAPSFQMVFPQALATGDGILVSLSAPVSPGAAFTNVDTYGMLQPNGTLSAILTTLPQTRTAVVKSAKGMSSAALPFAVDPLFAVSPDGQYSVYVDVGASGGATRKYTTTLVNAAGRSVYRRTNTIALRPMPRAFADSVTNALIADLRKRDAALAKAVEKESVRPAFFAPFTDVMVGNDGSVWLEQGAASGVSYVILSAAGAPGGTAALPAGARLVAVAAKQAWAVDAADASATTVIRYRVVD